MLETYNKGGKTEFNDGKCTVSCGCECQGECPDECGRCGGPGEGECGCFEERKGTCESCDGLEPDCVHYEQLSNENKGKFEAKPIKTLSNTGEQMDKYAQNKCGDEKRKGNMGFEERLAHLDPSIKRDLLELDADVEELYSSR